LGCSFVFRALAKRGQTRILARAGNRCVRRILSQRELRLSIPLQGPSRTGPVDNQVARGTLRSTYHAVSPRPLRGLATATSDCQPDKSTAYALRCVGRCRVGRAVQPRSTDAPSEPLPASAGAPCSASVILRASLVWPVRAAAPQSAPGSRSWNAQPPAGDACTWRRPPLVQTMCAPRAIRSPWKCVQVQQPPRRGTAVWPGR